MNTNVVANNASVPMATVMVGNFEINPSLIKDGWYKGWCKYHYTGKTTKGQVDDCYAFLRIVSDNGRYFLLDKESHKAFKAGFDAYKGEAGAIRKEFVSSLVDEFAAEAAKAQADLTLANNAIAKAYCDALDKMRARHDGKRPTEGAESEAYNNMLALLDAVDHTLFTQYAN